MKRKVLVLFPYLENYAEDIEKRNEIITLRRQISLIVSRVSDTLKMLMYKEINALDKSLGLECYPDIKLCVSDINDDNFTSGVRVCLTKYKNYDFSSEITFKRKDLEEKDVSHFVELEILDVNNKIIWETSNYKDDNQQKIFDSKLKSSIDRLYTALLSIMIDIYAYYIVGLYNDYEFRANFSKYKIENICTRESRDDIRRTYGINKDKISELDYLPISLSFQPNGKVLYLKETISRYYDIIQEYILVNNIIRFEGSCLKTISNSLPTLDEKSKVEILNSFFEINKKDISFSEYNYIGIYIADKSYETIKQRIYSQKNKSDKIVYNKNYIYFLCKEQINDNLPLFPHLKWFTLEENI